MDEMFSYYYVDPCLPNFPDALRSRLREDGIATFDQVRGGQQLIELATTLGTIYRHRDADEHGVTHIAAKDDANEEAGLLAFTASELSLHTDRSGIPNPPTFIALTCRRPAVHGGASVLVDGKQVYARLQAEYPEVLAQLTTPRSAIFGGADPLLIGSVFATLPNGRVYVRFRADALGYYCAPLLPSISLFRQILDDLSFAFTLGEGQGYVVQNGRWLHGRTVFAGDREVLRVLIDEGPRAPLGQRSIFGFTPGSGG